MESDLPFYMASRLFNWKTADILVEFADISVKTADISTEIADKPRNLTRTQQL